MGKNWDYSRLSQLAKKYGGPEKLMETVKRFSYQEGLKEGKIKQRPAIVIFSLLSFGIGFGTNKFYDYLKKRNVEKSSEITVEDVEVAEEILISVIKKEQEYCVSEDIDESISSVIID